MRRYWLEILLIFAIALMLVFCFTAGAETIPTKNAVRAIIGEASNQGYHGMLAIACGIRNRGTLKGVYGLRAKHVDSQPKWVWTQARKAWLESEYNRIHDGYMWENITAFGKPSWYNDVREVYRYKDHVFFVEKEDN